MPLSIIAPPLEAQEKFLWSEYTRADIRDVHALHETINRTDDDDHIETVQDLETQFEDPWLELTSSRMRNILIGDLETQFEDPWLEPRTDARVIRDAFGKRCALVRVCVNPKPERENLAFVECQIAPVAENERLGIRRGWTTKLGTRRAWRKHGLGTFLLAESMRCFRAEGFDYAGLGVDAENDSGALALYEGLGYRAYKTRFVFEKRVS